MDVANFFAQYGEERPFMSGEASKAQTLCSMCVYFPPNLPEGKYPPEDWLELQKKSCSFDYIPGDADCLASRKTSCSLVDLGSPGSDGANG
jgi:hypothetical protein